MRNPTVTIHVLAGAKPGQGVSDPSRPPGSVENPHPSIESALSHARLHRRLNVACGPIVLRLGAGTYRLERPIEITPVDHDLTIEAAEGGDVCIDGGVTVDGWRVGTHAGQVAWVADVRRHIEAGVPFRSLFVDGARRTRPTLPRDGWFRMESAQNADPDHVVLYNGGDRFVAAPGDVKAFANLTDIDVIVSHFWMDERMPIASFDPHTRLVTCTRRSVATLTDAWEHRYAKYRLENVGEALDTPGQWYLDRAAGTLTYLPLPGEDPATTRVVAPRLRQLARVMGTDDGSSLARNVTLRGLTFQHAEYEQPFGFGLWYDPMKPRHAWRKRESFDMFRRQIQDTDEHEWANTPQAALHVPGIVQFEQARECLVDQCTIRCGGWYAIALNEGCRDIAVTHCHLHDLGAGGVVIDGGGVDSPLHRRTGAIRIADTVIHNTGHVWRSACGVTIAYADACVVEHNEIFDLTYTGVSVGWMWNLDPHVTRECRIENNHIHHIGLRGGLSDMGGIYTLGVQPGTVIRGNHIHHVNGASYGGNGLYLDEGSSCMLVQQNLVHDCSTNGICEHFGRDNRFLDNVIAFCGTPASEGRPAKGAACSPCRDRNPDVPWPPRRTLIMRNVFVGRGTRLLHDNNTHLLGDCHVDADLNVYWDYANPEPAVFDALLSPYAAWPGETPGVSRFTLDQWQGMGFDRHSRVGDPGFADAERRQFAVQRDSIVIAMGVASIDGSAAGVRGVDVPLLGEASDIDLAHSNES